MLPSETIHGKLPRTTTYMIPASIAVWDERQLDGGMALCQAAARSYNGTHTISGSSDPVMSLPLNGTLHKFPQ